MSTWVGSGDVGGDSGVEGSWYEGCVDCVWVVVVD